MVSCSVHFILGWFFGVLLSILPGDSLFTFLVPSATCLLLFSSCLVLFSPHPYVRFLSWSVTKVETLSNRTNSYSHHQNTFPIFLRTSLYAFSTLKTGDPKKLQLGG